jgi:methionyl-tRNA synthetase
VAGVRACIERQALSEALEQIWKLVRGANAYIDRQAPWALKKTDAVRMEAVLRCLLDVLRTIATLLTPFMPDSMGRMLDQLGVPADARTIAALAMPLADGVALPVPSGIFPRFATREAVGV